MPKRIRIYRVTLNTNIFVRSLADVVYLADVINRKAVIITPQISFDYCRDYEDNKFVTCAIVGRVQYLVSGDNDLIDDESLKRILREYGIRILDAVSFIKEIENLVLLKI